MCLAPMSLLWAALLLVGFVGLQPSQVLRITSQTVNAQTHQLEVTVLNQGKDDVTAVNFTVGTSYDDGATLTSERGFDYYPSLALHGVDGISSSECIRPQESRIISLELPSRDSNIIAAAARISAVILANLQSVGDASIVQRFVAKRLRDRDSLRRRLDQVDAILRMSDKTDGIDKAIRALDDEERGSHLDAVGSELRTNLKRALANARQGFQPPQQLLESLREMMRRERDNAALHSQVRPPAQ